MPRKKKTIEEEEPESGSGWGDVFGSDVKRGIAAILLVMFGILFLFGFFDAAGPFGAGLDKGVASLFGWGKWLFPVVLFVAAVFLLRRRETTLSDIVKFIGLGVVFVSVLGFFHLIQGGGPHGLLEAVRAGRGGGYIGYGIAYVLLRYTGFGAGAVILSAFMFSGLIAAFNVSLSHLLSRAKRSFLALRGERIATGPEEGEESEETEESEEETEGSEEERAEAAEETETEEASEADPVPDDRLEDHNIKELRFSEDEPDASEIDEDDDEEEYDEDGEDDDEEEETDEEEPRSRRRRRKSVWSTPPIGLFQKRTEKGAAGNAEDTKRVIQNTLRSFGISGEMGDAVVGPTVTQYTFRPAFGTRLSKILTLGNDLALALARHPIRIEAPIPNTSLVGIEVPNDAPATVRMRELLESPAFRNRKSSLSVPLGETVSGSYEIANLESMPHLLIAGQTGSGKSVCIDSILLSLLYQNTPDELRLILVDPKRVGLALYKGIPHLKGNGVITDVKKVVAALKYAVQEMERRLAMFERVHARDLASYMAKVRAGETYEETDSQGNSREKRLEPMPYIVIVIDEMADLMMSHGKDVEAAIVRLAQMSRAAGIHLVLATQKPISDVVTGLIKSNVPTKIAFAVSNQTDSRIILDTGGAEKLVGKGDMLYSPSGSSRPKRIQGVFVDDAEVKGVVDFLIAETEKHGGDDIGGDYDEPSSDGATHVSDDLSSFMDDADSDRDERYEEAKRVVIETGRAATTFLQRKLSIGYGRAAKILDELEEDGVIGPAEGNNRGRVVLVGKAAGEAGDAEYDDPMRDQAARDKWQV